VVLATPAPAAATLIANLDGELAALLRGIGYAAVTLVHLGLAREAVGHRLDGAGFLAPKGESAVMTGNLWMSALFPDRAPPGKVLLTSYLGGARAPRVADWDDRRLVDETLATLRPLVDLRADPEMIRIDRHPQALPQYQGAYQARMQAIAKRLEQVPGLHLEANYRGGVSVRDRLARGQAVANDILAASPDRGSLAGIGFRQHRDRRQDRIDQVLVDAEHLRREVRPGIVASNRPVPVADGEHMS
jgi:oxygen-dependent protoporphyrinogen oxidase